MTPSPENNRERDNKVQWIDSFLHKKILGNKNYLYSLLMRGVVLWSVLFDKLTIPDLVLRPI